jgi:hypothetical protein
MPAKPPVKAKSRRFPTFDVPPGAPVILASQIERAIDEEDLLESARVRFKRSARDPLPKSSISRGGAKRGSS